ncbi:MAG TPA: SDR family oxidoreductase [Nitrososphaeraceae archaeon]|jgi:NAD(P)-dependent dehydrogenase (short-subunit alcohol dehydrogenase family)|nr:SDR family oxidoreductase [Nitrososphaeraceae archaeon]
MVRQQEVAVVTGSSTGIGFETSLELARNGFHTYATMRKIDNGGSNPITNIAKNENLPLKLLQLDVDSDKSVLDAVNKIVTENGRIDVLVNNAGYALVGALEQTSMEEIKAQFETNFFGAVRVMQAAIPIMRKQRSGRIVNITSMGGRVAIPLDSIYHATKFALEGLSESIQYELGPFGIKVILIEPGAVGTNFWKNWKMAAKAERSGDNTDYSQYKQIENNMSESFKQMVQNAIHPSEVAKVILQAVKDDNPNFRHVVGKDAATILESRKRMSDSEFQDFFKKQFNLQSIS